MMEWQYNEMKFSGVDFGSSEEVAAYDRMHRKFRNYQGAADTIVATLGLTPASTVIDLGCGTGAFALYTADKCRTIHAVDISRAMLDYCRQQAEERRLANIVFHHGGLLTYEHTGEPADAIVCVAVLHHLPDHWKEVALERCVRMLTPGGRLFLFDIVFPSTSPDLATEIDGWLAGVEQMADARLAAEAAVHIRDEYSTYDWVLEGMLERAGFTLESAEYAAGFQATYVCTRP